MVFRPYSTAEAVLLSRSSVAIGCWLLLPGGRHSAAHPGLQLPRSFKTPTIFAGALRIFGGSEKDF
jgi:hypothetical protein